MKVRLYTRISSGAKRRYFLFESFAEFNELLLADLMAEHAVTPELQRYYRSDGCISKGIDAFLGAQDALLEQAIYDGVSGGTCGVSMLRTVRQMVEHVIPSQFFLEISNICVAVDEQILHSRHLREILQMFDGEGAAEGGMVRSACHDPSGCRGSKVWLRCPEGTGDGKLGQGMLRAHEINLVDDQAEAVSHANYRYRP